MLVVWEVDFEGLGRKMRRKRCGGKEGRKEGKKRERKQERGGEVEWVYKEANGSVIS